MKKAFTIIELMMVIAIVGVLLGIITTAAAGSIKQARERRASSCCAVVQQGLATYYAQYGKWPGSIGSRIESGNLGSRNNTEGANYQSDDNKYILNASEANEMIRELIMEAKKGNPLMDISGLFVSRHSGEPGSRDRGLDFMSAVRGTETSPKRMKTAEMNFGYPESSHGYFRRFKITYSIPTDEMSVSTQ
jgi:prepilin-type N-terminal cleavage/methylation domain-containing protein